MYLSAAARGIVEVKSGIELGSKGDYTGIRERIEAVDERLSEARSRVREASGALRPGGPPSPQGSGQHAPGGVLQEAPPARLPQSAEAEPAREVTGPPSHTDLVHYPNLRVRREKREKGMREN